MSQTLEEPRGAPRAEPEPLRLVPRDWEWAGLILVVSLAAGLRIWHLDRNGTGNPYYAAAVRSMLGSGSNFFFGSFDPAGVVTVDKPPVALWIQAASARLLGYKGLNLLLPQALMGVASVLLTGHLVRRAFGTGAGLLAALILAITPIGVAVDRDNLPDSALVLVLLLAAWAVSLAAETRRLRPLLAAAALVGVGFNIKMLAAFVVLPTFYLAYLLASPLSWRARLGHLAAATAVLAAVSLSWSVAVELTPKSRRPYIGGSKTNSAIELALGYNGWGRVFGGSGNLRPPGGRGGPGGPPAPQARALPAIPAPPVGPMPGPISRDRGPGSEPGFAVPPDPAGLGAPPHGSGPPPGASDPSLGRGRGRWIPPGFGPPRVLGGGPGGPGGPGGGFGGPPGLLRFANPSISGQITWLFPIALMGLGAAAAGDARRRPAGREAVAILVWGGWLATHWAVFSFAQGIFHEYYTVVLGPAVAALAAIGLLRLAESGRRGGWRALLLPAALGLTAAWQAYLIAPFTGLSLYLLPAVIGGAAVGAIGLLASRWLEGQVAASSWVLTSFWVGTAALLIAPTLWALSPVLKKGDPMMPAASPAVLGFGGPTLGGLGFPGLGGPGGMIGGGPPGMPGMESEATTEKLVAFLKAHRHGERFLLAAPSTMEVSQIIITTGEPAISLGGFMGQDKVFTKDQFVAMVDGGQIRYVLLGGGPGGGGPPGGPGSLPDGPPGGPGGPGSANAEILAWVREHGKPVDRALWRAEDAGDMLPFDLPMWLGGPILDEDRGQQGGDESRPGRAGAGRPDGRGRRGETGGPGPRGHSPRGGMISPPEATDALRPRGGPAGGRRGRSNPFRRGGELYDCRPRAEPVQAAKL